MRVADVVHEAQAQPSGKPLPDMILHNQPAARHSKRLPQQCQRIASVMQNVNQHDPIEAGLAVRKIPSVEGLHGQPDSLPNQHIDSFDAKIRTLVDDRARQFSVATADIEKTAIGRDQIGKKLRKTADTPAVNVRFMELAEHTHFRASPRMLKKKLARMVSTPNVIDTITAATRRTRTTGFIAPNPARFHKKRE